MGHVDSKPPLLSFTMLTMNAADHALLKSYHRAEDEKRILVTLPESRYADWLAAPPEQTLDFIWHFPADNLVAAPIPPKKLPANAQEQLLPNGD